MLTLEQTKSATVEAFNFIAANPLSGGGALRVHLQDWMLKTFAEQSEYWGEATAITGEDIVWMTQNKAYADANQAAKDAIEAKVLAEWKARMDAPARVDPIVPTVYVPPAPKTYGEHIEAIKALYDGPDPENRVFDLAAACRYALENGITPDQVAGATGRHHTDCSNVMYPR